MNELTIKTLPLSPLRKIIKERMTESFQIPQFQLEIEVGMENILKIREEMAPSPSITACLIYACAKTLKQHPEINGFLQGNELCLVKEVNIGVAVSIPGGLIVPVLKNADQKSLSQLTAELKEKVRKGQNKQLSADDLQHGTFTISNLGMYQIKAFNPLINPPQLGILGVGGLQTGLKLVAGEIQEYKYINVTLTSDHRAIDGAVAAEFVNDFRDSCQSL